MKKTIYVLPLLFMVCLFLVTGDKVYAENYELVTGGILRRLQRQLRLGRNMPRSF